MFRSRLQENTQYSFLIERTQQKPRLSSLTITDPEIVKIKETSFDEKHRASFIRSTGEREALYLQAEVVAPPIFEGYAQKMHLTIDRWYEPRPRLRTDFGQTHVTIICKKDEQRIELRFYCDSYGQIKDTVVKDGITNELIALTSSEKERARLHTSPFTSFLSALLQYKTEVYLNLARDAQRLDDELSLIFDFDRKTSLMKIEQYILIAQKMHQYQPERQTNLLLERLKDRRLSLSASPSSVTQVEATSPTMFKGEEGEEQHATTHTSRPKQFSPKKKKNKDTQNECILRDLKQQVDTYISQLIEHLHVIEAGVVDTFAYQHAYLAQKGILLLEVLEIDCRGQEKKALQSFIATQKAKIPRRFEIDFIQYFKNALLSGDVTTVQALHPVVAGQLNDHMEDLVVEFLIKFTKSTSTQDAMGDVCEFMLEHSGAFKMAFIRALRIYISTDELDYNFLFRMLLLDNYRAFSIALQYIRLDFPILIFKENNFSPLQLAIYFYTEQKNDQRFIRALLEQKVSLEFDPGISNHQLTAINPKRVYRDQGKNIAVKYAQISSSTRDSAPKPIDKSSFTPILKEHLESIILEKNALELAIGLERPSLIPILCRQLSQRDLLDFFGKIFFWDVFIDRLSPYGIKEPGKYFYKDIATLQETVQERPGETNHAEILFYISEQIPPEAVDYYLHIGTIVYQLFIEFHADFPDEVLREEMQKLRRSGEKSERNFDLLLCQFYCMLLREKTIADHELFIETYDRRSRNEEPLLAIQGLFYLSGLPQDERSIIREGSLYKRLLLDLRNQTKDNEMYSDCIDHLEQIIMQENAIPATKPG